MTETPTQRAVREFGQQPGSLADRLGHQSVWKFADGGAVAQSYAEHAAPCGVCADLDAGGDGLGGGR